MKYQEILDRSIMLDNAEYLTNESVERVAYLSKTCHMTSDPYDCAEDKLGLVMCTGCGSLINKGDLNCGICGAVNNELSS